MQQEKGSPIIGELSNSTRYKAHMKAISEALKSPPVMIGNKETLEEEPEYKLILESNRIVQEIDEEIVANKRFVVELYSKKFPELESLVPSTIDYVKSVKRIGNEMDLTLVDLSDILSSSLVMVVSVSASTTAGVPLAADELSACQHGCDEVLKINADRQVLLQFVQSRMHHIAPNLCALLGSYIAAQLVGLAGGVIALSKIPSCNIQVLGQEKKNLAGLSQASTVPHAGVLYLADIVQSSPPAWRRKALKLVAAKVALIARVDAFQTSFNSGNSEGERMRSDLEGHLEKLQEPQAARTKKALPVPEEKARSRRGGKRVRKMKERYMVTELQKQQNKMSFTIDNGEYGDSAMGWDKGMIGSKDTGKVRAAQVKESKFFKQQKRAVSGSSGQTSGLSSSLVFTPVQGLELVNPNAAAERVKEANRKWFDSQSGFLSAVPK